MSSSRKVLDLAISKSSILNRRTQQGESTSSCGQDCCTPCFNGLEPNNLDGIIDLSGFGEDGEMPASMTCQEGYSLAEMVSSNDESCETMQLVGYAYCGCPTPPAFVGGEDLCTLCFDGSPVPDPELVIDMGTGETVSCGGAVVALSFLDALASSVEETDSEDLATMEKSAGSAITNEPYSDVEVDMCSIMQSSWGVQCGCPKDPNAFLGCSICPEGTTLTNPDKVVEVDDDDETSEKMTCGRGAQQALAIPNDVAFCAIIQSEASAAGCNCEIVNNPTTDESSTKSDEPSPSSSTGTSGIKTEVKPGETDDLDTTSASVIVTAPHSFLCFSLIFAAVTMAFGY